MTKPDPLQVPESMRAPDDDNTAIGDGSCMEQLTEDDAQLACKPAEALPRKRSLAYARGEMARLNRSTAS
jgi:hypothetical protein